MSEKIARLGASVTLAAASAMQVAILVFARQSPAPMLGTFILIVAILGWGIANRSDEIEAWRQRRKDRMDSC